MVNMKYTYKVLSKVAQETYLHHTGVDIFADGEYDIPITLTVEAESEEEAFKFRTYVTDIRMWDIIE